MYVSNRTSKILDVTSTEQWHYVRTLDNPAHVLSKEVKAHELKNIDICWHGPKWLSYDQNSWHSGKVQLHAREELAKQRAKRLALLS